VNLTTTPLQLRGPRHLVKNLDALGIDPARDGEHFIALDDEHFVRGVFEDSHACTGFQNVIYLVVDNQKSFEDGPDISNISARVPNSVHLLDALQLHQFKWRSLMCSDTTCCPLEGLPCEGESQSMPRRRALYAQWQAWLLTGEIPEQQRDTAVSSLRDLALRDAMLAGLVYSPNAISQWQNIFSRLPDISTAPLLGIMASVEFLLQRREKAHELLCCALEIEPQYSLAKLLLQAIDSDAPDDIVLSAFAKYTPEELLARATVDCEIEIESLAKTDSCSSDSTRKS
jgi:hypothetical protein